MNDPRVTKMWVHTVDKNGNDKGDGRWVDIPEPDRFASNGFSQVESYVSRMLRSSAMFTSVIISTPDGQSAVSLSHRDGVPKFSLSVDWRSKPESERAIRQFFGDRGLSASHDYLAGNGGVPDAMRMLGYFLPADAREITEITKDVLQQIFGVREQDALNFSYREHQGKAAG